MQDFNPIQFCNEIRQSLNELEKIAKEGIDNIKAMPSDMFGNKSEAIANSILAMRHIEDARMRFGKVIQYTGDQVSIYDKK